MDAIPSDALLTSALGRLPRRSLLVRSRPLLAGAVLVLAGVATVCCPALLPSSRVFETVAQQLGWLLFIVGVSIRLWATLYIGGRKNCVLAIAGPYSVTRNPLYFGALIAAVGMAVVVQSVYMLIGVAIATPLYTLLAIPDEEQRLARRWGDAYLRYAADVPRLWPDLSKWKSPQTIEVHLGGLKKEVSRAFLWLGLILIARLWLELH